MTGNKRLWFALVLGWLLPGLGHFFLKRHAYGAFYLGVIAALVVAGIIISGGTAVNFDDHRAYFACQALAGPAVIGLEFLRGQESIYLAQNVSILNHQTGVVYVATAGVLNLISLCELYRRHARPEAPGPSDTMRADAILQTAPEKA